MLHSFDLERTGSPKQSPEQLQALGQPHHAGLRQRSPSPDLHDAWAPRPMQQHVGLACVTDTVRGGGRMVIPHVVSAARCACLGRAALPSVCPVF